MKVACFLVLLCVAAVYEAEAGWWRKKAASKVGRVVKDVLGFVLKKDRKRRELREVSDKKTTKDVDKLCTRNHISALTPDGVPFVVIKDIFKTVDNQKAHPIDALNEKEVDEFVAALEIFKYCMTKGNRDNGFAP